MQTAWTFVKQNGFTLSNALKCAWANYKLRKAMLQGIVCFRFTKVDGSIRQAFGTLAGTPTTQGARRPAANVQTYFDTEKRDWRCFRKCNLLF